MPDVTASANISTAQFLRDLAADATARGLFETVHVEGTALRCKAKDAAADAWYTVAADGPNGTWMVRLATGDRWLSESIETDLMHYGDPIEELVEEELVELGHDVARDGAMPAIKHFRSEEKLYTFENPIPIDALLARGEGAVAVTVASRFLHAYEAAFRQLGDMAGGDEDE
jgi:hypothetical protein